MSDPNTTAWQPKLKCFNFVVCTIERAVNETESIEPVEVRESLEGQWATQISIVLDIEIQEIGHATQLAWECPTQVIVLRKCRDMSVSG
jgi:hypothetical protein